ncbi:MAG: hypothetical protein ACR2IV_08025 [Bryobacteraceae bacterium]
MRFSSLSHFITTTIAFFLTLVLCTGVTHAQQNDQLTGKWKMISTTPDGNDVRWTLSITYTNGSYSAMMGSDDGETAAKDFKVEGSKIHLRAPYQGEEYEIDLKLLDGKLIGTWSGNGDSGETKGEKANG